MPFRLANPTKLSPPTLFTTVEDAFAAGREFWPTEAFRVEEVRQAKLSDFFSIADLQGSLRERMHALCGDDSAMDQRMSSVSGLPNEGEKMFDHPLLIEAMTETLDAFEKYIQLDLTALLIVEHSVDVKPAE